MAHARSSANRSKASIGHSTVSSNPFDDAAPTQSRDQSVVDPTASTTASNPFDAVFEVQAGNAPSIANASIHTNHDQDKVLLELRTLNENMSRTLEALSFLTTSHAHVSPANTTPAPIFSQPHHGSAPSQPLPLDASAPSPPAQTVELTSGISISSIRTGGKSIRDAVVNKKKEMPSKTLKRNTPTRASMPKQPKRNTPTRTTKNTNGKNISVPRDRSSTLRDPTEKKIHEENQMVLYEEKWEAFFEDSESLTLSVHHPMTKSLLKEASIPENVIEIEKGQNDLVRTFKYCLWPFGCKASDIFELFSNTTDKAESRTELLAILVATYWFRFKYKQKTTSDSAPIRYDDESLNYMKFLQLQNAIVRKEQMEEMKKERVKEKEEMEKERVKKKEEMEKEMEDKQTMIEDLKRKMEDTMENKQNRKKKARESPTSIFDLPKANSAINKCLKHFQNTNPRIDLAPSSMLKGLMKQNTLTIEPNGVVAVTAHFIVNFKRVPNTYVIRHVACKIMGRSCITVFHSRPERLSGHIMFEILDELFPESIFKKEYMHLEKIPEQDCGIFYFKHLGRIKEMYSDGFFLNIEKSRGPCDFSQHHDAVCTSDEEEQSELASDDNENISLSSDDDESEQASSQHKSNAYDSDDNNQASLPREPNAYVSDDNNPQKYVTTFRPIHDDAKVVNDVVNVLEKYEVSPFEWDTDYENQTEGIWIGFDSMKFANNFLLNYASRWMELDTVIRCIYKGKNKYGNIVYALMVKEANTHRRQNNSTYLVSESITNISLKKGLEDDKKFLYPDITTAGGEVMKGIQIEKLIGELLQIQYTRMSKMETFHVTVDTKFDCEFKMNVSKLCGLTMSDWRCYRHASLLSEKKKVLKKKGLTEANLKKQYWKKEEVVDAIERWVSALLAYNWESACVHNGTIVATFFAILFNKTPFPEFISREQSQLKHSDFIDYT